MKTIHPSESESFVAVHNLRRVYIELEVDQGPQKKPKKLKTPKEHKDRRRSKRKKRRKKGSGLPQRRERDQSRQT